MKTKSHSKDLANQSAAKERAIVFGITNNLCFALGTILISFLKHNPGYDGTILVFHESLPEDQMRVLESIYPTISFREFTREHVEKRISKSANRHVIDRLISRYSIFYFAKFELPDLLDEFERVIWFDVDMLVRGPLETLWDFDEFTWRPAAPANKLRGPFPQLFKKEIKTMAYNRPNGGLIGICRNARKRGIVTSTQLYHWFNEIQTRGRSLNADEFTFFLLASTINADVKELLRHFNCFSTRHGCDTATVIHAVGAGKFWNSASMRLAYPDWLLWYNEWIRHGGVTYDGQITPGGLFVTTPTQLYNASLYQGIWRDIYYEIIDRLPFGVIPDIQTHNRIWQIFIQNWPRDQFFIGINKYSESFFIALHLEGAAAQKKTLVKKIDKLFSKLEGFEKVPTKLGLYWVKEVQEAEVPDLIIECAVAASKLPPPK